MKSDLPEEKKQELVEIYNFKKNQSNSDLITGVQSTRNTIESTRSGLYKYFEDETLIWPKSAAFTFRNFPK